MDVETHRAADGAILGALAEGLPLVSRPYAALAEQLGLSETTALEAVERLQHEGIISRFGVVVRHHELGYRANAMVVWDIPDSLVEKAGTALTAQPGVTLCYQRPRRLPR